MILDIFLPEKIGSNYLLSKRVAGFNIGKNYIYATQLYITGNKIIVEKWAEEFIDYSNTGSFEQKIIDALKKISQQLDKCDEIRTSLSSSVVLFKELTVPFTDYEKIALVLNYELEPLLPFSPTAASIDFIITKKFPETTQSAILAAVVQKNYIMEQVNYFSSAGLKLSAITVDIFDLYALYKIIPLYADKKDDIVLIDLSFDTTRIAYIIDQQLKFIRTLPKGLMHIAKSVSSQLGISGKESLEKILRFGLNEHDNQDHMHHLKEAYGSFFSEIQFTLQSFNNQITKQSSNPIQEIIFLSEGSQIDGVITFAQEFLALPCSFFDTHELIKNNIVTVKNGQRIPNSHIISLSTALSVIKHAEFNLLPEEVNLSLSNTFIKQFFASMLFLIAIFLILIMHSFIQQRALNRESKNMEREVINSLEERNLTDNKFIVKAVEEAQEKVEKEEELWFAFSRQTRFSFLKALQDLSSAIDKKALGLSLKKLVLTPNNIAIEGEVKGFPELKILEKELRESNLFIAVPPLQELKFNEKLFLKKNGEHS